MKLATLKNGTRDGKLIVVRHDGAFYADASDIAPSLQVALDNWKEIEPKLQKRSQDLNEDKVEHHPIDTKKLRSPLPRAYEWIDGSAYINHIVLVRKARNAEPPETLETDPLVYQGGSGIFLDPRQDIPIADESWGLDFEAEVAIILDDTPQGISKEDVKDHIKLIMLVNDVSLRNLIPPELKKGFGFVQSKPATAFSPFAITPDELGDHWKEGRVHLPLYTYYNGKKFGDPDAGPEMHFSFYDLVHHLTKTRSFTAGSIIGSGTVSNVDRSRGSSCLAEVRMIEKIDTGEFKTPFMKPGDEVIIEMFDDEGLNLFGSINQKVSK